ncbi:acyl-CoA dehydrogenase family protein [Teredinibacter sp. KSP-S5-2]|uniref:acyl-CoA dehydrogenase family protein n=1 Tax=Teredinibacter sp. KSP-S5-2 TaxID=3034506 RepID=UPI0029346031|nr:acyl-CoA dehydrogenase family protein [Teredinibacter sp. KSP-S5-2]WNO10693.1 acyl-CoA dehydrogenase family protein [Teredinibacter sp. KSP-S5-2]
MNTVNAVFDPKKLKAWCEQYQDEVERCWLQNGKLPEEELLKSFIAEFEFEQEDNSAVFLQLCSNLSYFAKGSWYPFCRNVITHYFALLFLKSVDQQPAYFPEWIECAETRGAILTGDFNSLNSNNSRILAKKEGHGWRLSGDVCHLTNLVYADFILLQAKVDQGEDVCLGMPLEVLTYKPGVTLGNPQHGSQGSCRLVDCFIDDSDVFRLMPEQQKKFERVAVYAAVAEAVADKEFCRYMFGNMLDEVRNRQTFGSLLIKNQHVEFILAELDAKLLAFESEVMLLIDNIDNVKQVDHLPVLSKALRESIADHYLQFSGGRGYIKGHTAEACFRAVLCK